MAGDRAANRAADLAIARELRLLGQSSPTPTTDLSTAVLAVIGSEPAPVRRSGPRRLSDDATEWMRTRWRAAFAVLLGAVVAVGAVTPVGATVARWFTFGGVEVVQGPNQPTGSPVSPPVSASPSPSARFTVTVPAGVRRPILPRRPRPSASPSRSRPSWGRRTPCPSTPTATW